MPRPAPSVPSVASIGGIRMYATRSPLTAPMSRPAKSDADEGRHDDEQGRVLGRDVDGVAVADRDELEHLHREDLAEHDAARDGQVDPAPWRSRTWCRR